MPKYVMDLKKCWGVENCLGGMPTNFVYGFEKKIYIFFLGGVVMHKYFIDLKNVGGGGGVCQQIYGLEKCLGGGLCQNILGI